MTATYDDLAGVVDLFGALTREELSAALAELAFKRGREVDEAALAEAIDEAVAEYYLVEYDPAGDGSAVGSDSATRGDTADENGALLVAGPTAFPTLPENAADLPHILDVPDRSVDRERLGEAVAERLLAEAARATADDDRERAAFLLDVSYDLEAWAPVDVTDAREQLAAALQD
ncbi:MAG: hypothetical protein ABEJ22_07655 [Haloferacaceae archaeon]